MDRIIWFLIYFSGPLLVFYLGASFIYLEINPLQWDRDVRAAFVFFGGAPSLILGIAASISSSLEAPRPPQQTKDTK